MDKSVIRTDDIRRILMNGSGTVIIIGGGLSGLSAGVELSSLGYKVELYEQRNICGGRTCSYFRPESGVPFDNGQHIMMGCYRETRRYIGKIGTGHLFTLQPSLRINYVAPGHDPVTFDCPRLPAPLHLIVGITNFRAVPAMDRIRMIGFSKSLLKTPVTMEKELDGMTADSWLVKMNQSAASRRYLWDVVTVGALNNYPEKVSALTLLRVLRGVFTGRRENSSLLLPEAELDRCLVKPAVEFIKSHNGSVFTASAIKKLNTEGNRIVSAQSADGREIPADFFISAVPWHAAAALLPPCGINYSGFQSSPIISIHLWMDRKVMDLDFAAVLDLHVQWIFDKTKKTVAGSACQYVSLVISGADDYIDLSNKELIEIAVKDLRSLFPGMSGARIMDALVIKEKRATFLPYPGLESVRPPVDLGFRNLFLAGDWTATGLPATIEGAVMSGFRSADYIDRLHGTCGG
jgi:squalene-associated FAD-dependent desaturase